MKILSKALLVSLLLFLLSCNEQATEPEQVRPSNLEFVKIGSVQSRAIWSNYSGYRNEAVILQYRVFYSDVVDEMEFKVSGGTRMHQMRWQSRDIVDVRLRYEGNSLWTRRSDSIHF